MKRQRGGKHRKVARSKEVPFDVTEQILGLWNEVQQSTVQKSREKSVSFGDENNEVEIEQEKEVSTTQLPSKVQTVGDKGKRKASASQNVSDYLAPRNTIPTPSAAQNFIDLFAPSNTPRAQPSTERAFQNEESIHDAKLRLARWMVESRIPFSAVQSPYFQDVLDSLASIGPGFELPSYDELRVHLLGDLKKECQLLIDSYRISWKNSGCTLMADCLTDQRQRTLINFLVYCPGNMSFVKSIDASDAAKNASTLCRLFVDVIEWVGASNIVHVVTNNAANYVEVGKLIHEKYDNIFWSPCAAHCLNLILQDIGSMPHITSLASRASKITVFVYNHVVLLSWLRKRSSWKEIVRPGKTRFSTVFLTLKNIYERKADLQALVVDVHFTRHKLGKSANGKAVSDIVLDNKFWESCYFICKLVSPLIRLLRIVESDEKPSLGYVYDGMQRAKKAIKEMFGNMKIAHQPYTEIIKTRWDKHLKRSLHAAAYFLNPVLFYDEKFIEKPRVLQGLLYLLGVKSLCSDSTKAIKEIQLYRQRKESFDRPNVLEAAKELQPSEWWRFFGGSAPNLKKIAVRILGQTSSAGCERNWTVFEQIHTKKRNRLEHRRLNDIVYVNYNLRLQSRFKQKRRSYNPIDHEIIDLVDFWVTEEVEEPELSSDIQELIYHDNYIPPCHVDDCETGHIGAIRPYDEDGHQDDEDIRQIYADFDGPVFIS